MTKPLENNVTDITFGFKFCAAAAGAALDEKESFLFSFIS